MNILTSVIVKGLWGSCDINLSMDEKYNFIIGVNGTGKTTLINLLAASLTFDIEKLMRIEFDSIDVNLKEIGGSKRPNIRVVKDINSVDDFIIKYEIKMAAKEKPIIIPIDSRYDRIITDTHNGKIYRRRPLGFDPININDTNMLLKSLIKISWLSVNRSDNIFNRDVDRKPISAIDYKVLDLNNELVRYFSLLSQKFAEHALDFQKKSFLAVINNEGTKPIFNFSKTIDVEKEKITLKEVFEVLGVDSRYYAKKLNDHFSRLDKVKSKDRSSGITVDDFTILYNSWRAHTLVADYEVLQTKKTEIFKPRDNFINLLNNMFGGRKKFSVSDKNELVVVAKDDRPIELNELSSGEKQLLIILGEALLQNSKSTIYIADEPELSLHVIWQEQLTGAISKLNPNAQIIFATHSPDIVGSNQDNIIDMESLLS